MTTPDLQQALKDPRPHRRRRWIAVCAILALLSGVLGGYRIFVQRYQPVGLAVTWVPADWDREGDFMGSGRWLAPYEYGETSSYGLTVTNRGRWGITFLGFEAQPAGVYLLLRPTALRMPRWPNSFGGPGEIPFEPFAIPPGESRYVAIEGRFDDCHFYQPESLQELTHQMVRFRLAGVTRRATIEMEGPRLAVPSAPAGGCPTPEQLGAEALEDEVTGVVTRGNNVMICIKPGLTDGERCFAFALPYSTRGDIEIGGKVTLEPDASGDVSRVRGWATYELA
jgi:hypothetical protein